MKNIAIVGATGLVGQALIEILEERNFPIKKLYLLASHRSIGESLLFKNKPILVQELAKFNFNSEKIDIAFFFSWWRCIC
jgi:aspartate-semialdehyde dehydrogenase